MPHPQVDAVATRADAGVDQAVTQLCEYLAIPAISCEAEHADDVRALAAKVAEDLSAIGLHHARVLDLPNALPIVAADWLQAGDDKPTVLIYGHLDLQPVAGEVWRTDPHVGTVVDDRLYARGSADDMGGWVSHMVALAAWLAETGELPCNVRLVIEGEEEIGSPNLERFMDAYPDAFEADAMVLTDCENPSTEVPGLTVSLRGLLEVELTARALSSDVHSGLWGGMVPDVSTALVLLIGRLLDEDGRLKVGRVQVDEARRRSGHDVPLTDDVIREGAHLVDGVQPLPRRERSAAEWMWWQPAMTVVATTLPTRDVKKNALRQEATAVLSVRLAPEQKAEDMMAALRDVLLVDPPGGVEVQVEAKGWAGEGWLYTPKGPAFAAADRAYEKAWGHKLVQVGVGGSIPFVALFGRRFGDLPLILNGVMDPLTTAHGPNESMHLGIFRKAVAANVHLLDELAALGKVGIRA
ncbi:MAG: M20/M25/M40 family metallo-hydrolase [Myxococcales bacterium]|nr:M20/M25/M40 family metallo-hydrolase [Myxococcales bacterium]